MRHINWKASAHADNLLVKAYQPVISLDTMILVNLNLEDYSARNRIDGPEWSIILAASLAAHLTEARQAVGLATNGFDPLRKYSQSISDPAPFDSDSGRLSVDLSAAKQPIIEGIAPQNIKAMIPPPIQPNPGQAQLMTILEILARVEAGHSEPFASYSAGAVSFLSWGITILVISPTGDLQTCRSLHNFVRRGYNPLLVIAEPYADFQTIQRRVRPYGFPTVHISSERELRNWLQPSQPHPNTKKQSSRL